jgi:hypothetical protein
MSDASNGDYDFVEKWIYLPDGSRKRNTEKNQLDCEFECQISKVK